MMNFRIVVDVEFPVALDTHGPFRGPEHIVMHTELTSDQIQAAGIPMNVMHPVVVVLSEILWPGRQVDSGDIRIENSGIEDVVVGNFRSWLPFGRSMVVADGNSIRAIIEERIPTNDVLSLGFDQQWPAFKVGMPIVFQEDAVIHHDRGTA